MRRASAEDRCNPAPGSKTFAGPRSQESARNGTGTRLDKNSFATKRVPLVWGGANYLVLYFSRIGLSRSISSREAFSPAAGAPAWCWGFVLALGIAVRTRCGFVDALGIAFGGGVAVGVGWIRCGLVDALGAAFGGGVAVGVGVWIRCGLVDAPGFAFGGGVAVGVGVWIRCGLVDALGFAPGTSCAFVTYICSEAAAAIICSVAWE